MRASSLTGCKLMKTYYDGEEREVLKIEPYFSLDGKPVWLVTYRRGESQGNLIVVADDELDAFNKFPEVLARMSINHEE